MTPDGRRVYIPNRDSSSVSVIDTARNTIIATIAVGTHPEGIAVTPDGRHVYVPNYCSNSVSVIDTVDNTVADTIPVSDNLWDGSDPGAHTDYPKASFLKGSGCQRG